MRPIGVAVLVAAAGFAAFALAAQDVRDPTVESQGRFLDALAPGDRISIEQRVMPSDCGDVDGSRIDVITEEEIRERSLAPEEISELKRLRDSDDISKRRQELESKVTLHPMEVVEVGADYVAYRLWNGRVTYLPERQIRMIYRPSLKQK